MWIKTSSTWKAICRPFMMWGNNQGYLDLIINTHIYSQCSFTLQKVVQRIMIHNCILESDKSEYVNQQDQPTRKIKWPSAIIRLTAHFTCVLSDLEIFKYGHTWHPMSRLRPGVLKQHKCKSKDIHLCKEDFLALALLDWYKVTWHYPGHTFFFNISEHPSSASLF